MDIDTIISNELEIDKWQVGAARELFQDGNTLPFIARYRKEKTGSLNEIQLREINKRIEYLENLNKRKEEVLKSIDSQGKLTPELQVKIEKADKLSIVEDIYLPYKKRKKTRADIAIEKGLSNAVSYIWSAKTIDDKELEKFINPENEILSIDDVLSGCRDIVAQQVSENMAIRIFLRNEIKHNGLLVSKKTKNSDEKEVYKDYYDFTNRIQNIQHFRVLALNRGSKNKILKLSIEFEDSPVPEIISRLKLNKDHPYYNELEKAINDSFTRLLMPSLFNESFSELMDVAEERAIEVFAENLRNLLLTKPLPKKRILGIDPGFRTGCKIVSISEYGDILDHGVIFPHQPHNKTNEAGKIILNAVSKYNIDLIVIGNGTASRETASFIVDLINNNSLSIKYAIVSEAGASVYSASDLAAQEFPEYDVTTRGAISIARRIQDPLAEFVKIPPESIGIGMYQHDIKSSALKKSLEREVESVVNHVGVNLNTASQHLLKYISGLNNKSAENIVKHRRENGPFKNRREIMSVKSIGAKAFEQAAGFCRIPESDNDFDNTIIHPENYETASRLIKLYNATANNFKDRFTASQKEYDNIAQKLGCSTILLNDIVQALKNKGLDPRDDMPQVRLSDDVLTIDDLKEDMVLQGTVTNVVDFGAFIDIGLKNSGLLHKSNISKEFVKDPSEYLSVGQIIDVKIISIDKERGRIGLSTKDFD